jgi:enamine deaminase RidA (YjgF/YER057c/UK114 family)
MPKLRTVTSPKVAEPPPGRWSNCKQVGDHVFIAGLVAQEPGAPVPSGEYAQAKSIFEKIKNLMEAAGGAMNDVARVRIFVTNIKNREQVWKARAEYFTGDFPCSTLVEVSALATPELTVEIDAEGYIGSSK